MAKSNRQYIFDTLELLDAELKPFVVARLDNSQTGHWQSVAKEKIVGLKVNNGEISWDLACLLKAIMVFWVGSFKSVLTPVERSYVSEILDVRNKLAHNNNFSSDDTERAMDTVKRLMESISAGESAEKISSMRTAVIRRQFDEKRRNEERKRETNDIIKTGNTIGLKSWREIVQPRQDVITGNYELADFAADLSSVHNGSAHFGYGNPSEFFKRTYLTAGLEALLIKGAERLSGRGGDPVVELQTNFGGGKTHSMLALYHMCGDTPVENLTGVDQLVTNANVSFPKNVKRAVIVGTAVSPVNPIRMIEGVSVRTLWGDLAWQLGGMDGYSLVEENDKMGISPGSNLLSELLSNCAPCLILIDEWVAYLRHIFGVSGLPSGSFDTNISFVQALTEAVKASPKALLVASLPQSTAEAGGEGGAEALKRLQTTFGRLDTRWSHATTEESYEIVRRRLFEEVQSDMYQCRDDVIRQFSKMYNEYPDSFPARCVSSDYERLLASSYPVHPELFDQLNHSWGTLERFQKTRGLLRLMATAVHDAWMNSDPSLMIMPGSITVASDLVKPELLKSLPKEWDSIIVGDVDSASSTPFEIDKKTPSLGKISATRRIARTIFIATSPLEGSQNPGIDTKSAMLGTCQPNERPVVFEDALQRLCSQARYMHASPDGSWYSRNPSINREAIDKASRLEEILVAHQIDQELKNQIMSSTNKGPFQAVQVAPEGSADIPDEPEGVRLVVLGVSYPHNGKSNSLAVTRAMEIFQHRGKSPRSYRNTLIFLALNMDAWSVVNETMRRKMAWEGILSDGEDRLKSEISLAKKNLEEAKKLLNVRLQESWCQLILPTQETPQDDVEWEVSRVVTQGGILEQIGKKLISSEGVFEEIGARRLKAAISNTIWKDESHLLLSQIWEYCNRFIYLPRLCGKSVLKSSVGKAISGNEAGPFAYADSVGDDNVYEGLVIEKGNPDTVVVDTKSVIVDSAFAEELKKAQPIVDPEYSVVGLNESDADQEQQLVEAEDIPKSFYGMVELSADRPAKDMGKILDEVVSHITSAPNGSVTLRLEIEGEFPQGLDKRKLRTILENANILGFKETQVK